MLQEAFFETIQVHYENRKPFVMYKKPNTELISAVLQLDDSIYNTTEFTESGFVFAPFDDREETILFPLEQSDCLTCSMSYKELSIQEGIKAPVKLNTESCALAKHKHINLVAEALESMSKSSLKKVVVSRKENIDSDETNPFILFKRLLAQYNKAFTYCWFHPKIGLWLGATPESLFSISGAKFSTMALAGTRSIHELSQGEWSEKEIDEQQIVSDFIINGLKTMASHINIAPTETIQAGELLHLRTQISGIINRSKLNLKLLLTALHPTPAVCGFPKRQAKAFILEHEAYNRRYYTGFLGEMNFKERRTRNANRRNVENSAYAAIKVVSNFFVNLRCMELENDKAFIYVGGGITADSVPEKEWEETCNKTLTIKNIL